jgi:hypothetical protein
MMWQTYSRNRRSILSSGVTRETTHHRTPRGAVDRCCAHIAAALGVPLRCPARGEAASSELAKLRLPNRQLIVFA